MIAKQRMPSAAHSCTAVRVISKMAALAGLETPMWLVFGMSK
jgi:hypothetical protein